MKRILTSLLFVLLLCNFINSQTLKSDEKAEAIIKKAVEKLGGERYLQVKSVVGKGNYTTLVAGQLHQLIGFVDVIVFPDRERTEFKTSGVKNIQANVGATGWLFDGAEEAVKDQNKRQIEDFRRGMRVSVDNLLRGYWRAEEGVALSYVGRRQAGVGKRNDVVRLTYADGFAVEFEFSDDGFPAKSVYKRTNDEGAELKEEDRYAQFVNVQGIYAPFIVDHFINGNHTSRINYTSIEFNKTIPDSIFNKPSDAKTARKDLKL
jgi:hypothetical protein